MKKIPFILSFFLIFSCAGEQKVIKPEPVKQKEKPAVKKVTPVQKTEIKIGWADKDTYTVKVVAKDLETAKDAAKHRILKDIVNVRMMNRSKYMDIEKISAEFEKPLKNGKVIQTRVSNNGLEIYFQITDKDLKTKFERK